MLRLPRRLGAAASAGARCQTEVSSARPRQRQDAQISEQSMLSPSPCAGSFGKRTPPWESCETTSLSFGLRKYGRLHLWRLHRARRSIGNSAWDGFAATAGRQLHRRQRNNAYRDAWFLGDCVTVSVQQSATTAQIIKVVKLHSMTPSAQHTRRRWQAETQNRGQATGRQVVRTTYTVPRGSHWVQRTWNDTHGIVLFLFSRSLAS